MACGWLCTTFREKVSEMARRKDVERGRIKVDDLGVDVPLMPDEHNVFYARCGDHLERGKTAEEVGRAMERFIRETFDIHWRPFVKTTMLSPGTGQIGSYEDSKVAFAGLKLWRGYVGRKMNGQYLQCNWDVDPDTRLWQASSFYWPGQGDGDALVFPLEKRGTWGDTSFYYDYSDDLWQRLTYVRDEIGRVRGLLDILLGSPAGIERLLGAPMHALLQAPREEVE